MSVLRPLSCLLPNQEKRKPVEDFEVMKMTEAMCSWKDDGPEQSSMEDHREEEIHNSYEQPPFYNFMFALNFGLSPKFALIVLNRPIDIPLIQHLWKKSSLTAVTDGAINRVRKYCSDQKEEYVPDIITGDFDSATPSTLDYYRNKGVEIIHTPDQDETDFTKCLRIVFEKSKSLGLDQIIAVSCFGGRIDHIFANINTLYTSLSLSPQPLLLIHEGSMACLLDKGKHTLHVDTGLEGQWCGLIPVGHPAHNVTTTGLKYNLSGQCLAFGELMSTSNALAASVVTVSSDQPLLWTMSYKQ